MLTIIKRVDNTFTGGRNRITYLCKCDCGKEIIRLSQNLDTKCFHHCGCYNSELAKKYAVKGKKRYWNYKHGMFGTKFYGIYFNIVARCNDPKNISYRFYGKLGIKNDFKSFEEFKEHLYKPYLRHKKYHGERNTTIERLDSSKNYSPTNCRWATYKEQENNRKDNVHLTYKGKTKTLAQWAEYFKISKHLAYHKVTGLNYNTNRPNQADNVV